MRRFIVCLLLMAGSFPLLACSSTTTAHTGVGSLDESRAETKEGADVPRISFAISILFREKPTDGAITELVNGITQKLPNSISPWGAATNSLALTPASGLSSIESGRRGQVFLPFFIDVPRGSERHVRITLGEIKAAAKKALAEEGVPPGMLDGVVMGSMAIEIHAVNKGDKFDGFSRKAYEVSNGS